MNQNISINCLYIPNTFGLDAAYIKFVFECDYCKIDNIEFLGKLNNHGQPYTSARVYVGEWYSNVVSNNFIQRLINNNCARVIFDNESEMYWNVMPNKSSKITRQQRINLTAFDNKKTFDFDKVLTKNDTSLMLSNSDFAAMYKSEHNDFVYDDIDYDDIEFKNACRRLVVDDDEESKSKMSLRSADDYVVKLEKIIAEQNQKIEELTNQLNKIKKII